MTFKLEIQTDGAAFEDRARYELADILSEVGGAVMRGEREGNLRDYNGNTVGRFEWRED